VPEVHTRLAPIFSKNVQNLKFSIAFIKSMPYIPPALRLRQADFVPRWTIDEDRHQKSSGTTDGGIVLHRLAEASRLDGMALREAASAHPPY